MEQSSVEKVICVDESGQSALPMRDCQVNLTIKDGKVRVHVQNTSVEELALMCGALENALGYIGYKHGTSMEEIKTSMLDIHLGAMQDLEKKIRAEEKDGKI